MRKRFLIIHNADAGTLRRRLFRTSLAALIRRGAVLTIEAADSVADDARLAREAVRSGACDAVIAAGGDSTIRGVAGGLLGSALPMGILPLGTANVMAAEIGLARRADALAEQLMGGPARPIYGGRANGEAFFLMAAAGFDAAVVAALNTSLKRRIGKAAYAGAIVKALAQPPPRLVVDVDGSGHEARWAIVAKARSYAGSFVLSPSSSIHDPELTTILFQPRHRAELLAQLVRLAAGTLTRAPRVTVLQGRRTVIRSQIATPVQIDGEPHGTTPLVIEREPQQVLLLTPPSSTIISSGDPAGRDAAE